MIMGEKMFKLIQTKLNVSILIAGSLFTMFSFAGGKHYPELKTVSYVDLNRYIGTWHQIAYLPNSFQKNCTINTTATYSLRSDGKIGVHNECSKKNGKRKTIDGKAKIIDTLTNAKLSVKFFWFQPGGDYWIIDLADDYSYAVVGAPNRKYLWILARNPSMESTQYNQILERIKEKDFDISKIQITSDMY